jgi:threonine aldolase
MGIEIDPATVRTNIVIFRLAPELCGGSSMTFLGRLKEAGVLGVPVNPEKVRFVTHRDVSRGEIDAAVERIGALAG